MSGVLLAGDVGARDPGEDALLAAFARELPGWRIVVTSADPESVGGRHGCPAVNVHERRALLGAVRGCAVLLLGDGALRGRVWGQRARDVLPIAFAAKAMGRRLALLGVGAGQLDGRSDRLRVGAIVRLSDLLVLRDATAARTLVAAGAPGPFRVGADPAWCALDPARPAADRGDDALVIVDARAAPIRSAVPARLAAALDLIAARGLRIRLAPWRTSRYGADDLDLARAIAERLGARARILLPPANLAEACDEATRARVVIGLRLHALIVAANAGTPAVAIDGEPETSNLADRLGQPALPLDANPDGIAAAALSVLDASAAQPEAVRRERAAAREAFRLLRLLLEGDRSDEDLDVVALPLVPEPVGRRVAGGSRSEEPHKVGTANR